MAATDEGGLERQDVVQCRAHRLHTVAVVAVVTLIRLVYAMMLSEARAVNDAIPISEIEAQSHPGSGPQPGNFSDGSFFDFDRGSGRIDTEREWPLESTCRSDLVG